MGAPGSHLQMSFSGLFGLSGLFGFSGLSGLFGLFGFSGLSGLMVGLD